jgi:predicted nucleotidyltransferase
VGHDDKMNAAGRREHLARLVERTLSEDRRVRSVSRFGSLPADEDIPDLLSDIDVLVSLEAGVSDLAFVEAVPRILSAVGPVVVACATSLGPIGYTAHVYFDGFSPWMHVDVRCESPTHEEDPAFDSRHQWSLGYRHWLLAVKRLARAYAFLGEARHDITGAAVLPGIPLATANELRRLLEAHHSKARPVDGADALYAICSDVAGRLDTLTCRAEVSPGSATPADPRR